jgi:hypothetical protein
MSTFRLVLFPSNTTSVSQQLDQGIIKFVNLNCREITRSLISNVKSASFTTELVKPYQSLTKSCVVKTTVQVSPLTVQKCLLNGLFYTDDLNDVIPVVPDIVQISNIDL